MAVVKFSTDIENYGWDFALQKSIQAGDSIASIVSITWTALSPAGATVPTVVASSISGTQVVAKLSGAQAGASYEGRCIIITTGGKQLTSVMPLDVPY